MKEAIQEQGISFQKRNRIFSKEYEEKTKNPIDPGSPNRTKRRRRMSEACNLLSPPIDRKKFVNSVESANSPLEQDDK